MLDDGSSDGDARLEAKATDLSSLLAKAREGYRWMREFGHALGTQIDTSSGSAEAIVRIKANFLPLMERIGGYLEEFHNAIDLGKASVSQDIYGVHCINA